MSIIGKALLLPAIACLLYFLQTGAYNGIWLIGMILIAFLIMDASTDYGKEAQK